MSSGTSAALRGEIRQEWWVVDATNKVLGRLATRVARVLCGKHRAPTSRISTPATSSS